MKTSNILKFALLITMPVVLILPSKVAAQQNTDIKTKINNFQISSNKEDLTESKLTLISPVNGSSTASNSVNISAKITTNNPLLANKNVDVLIIIGDTTSRIPISGEDNSYSVASYYNAVGSELLVNFNNVALPYKGNNYIYCVIADRNSDVIDLCGESQDQYDLPIIKYTGNELPVYRFWSRILNSHFYTGSIDEKRYVESTYQNTWYYEGFAYYISAYDDNSCEGNLSKVHRFWSPILHKHFYTANESEKNYVIATYPNVWNYERVAYCASEVPQNQTKPVYRFWSDKLKTHFYTISESEKEYVIRTYPDTWKYEKIAYYALDTASASFE